MANLLGYARLLNRIGANIFVPIFDASPGYSEVLENSTTIVGSKNKYTPPIPISDNLSIDKSSTIEQIQSCYQYTVELNGGLFTASGISCLENSGRVIASFTAWNNYKFLQYKDAPNFPTFQPFIVYDSAHNNFDLCIQWGEYAGQRGDKTIEKIGKSESEEYGLVTADVKYGELKIYQEPVEPKPINFYRSSPEGDINVSRGETVNLEFTIVYEDGSTFTPYTDVVYSNLPPKSTAIFVGNSFIISENCRASIFTSIARPNIGETTLYAPVQAKILNPVNPYLPDDGGVSGGGSQSGSSNVIGSFNGTPGPSVAGGIPDGAVGSDIASSGMYTKYLCDAGILNVIAQYLWEDNVGIQALKAIIGNPIDSIISLISYPFALDSLVSSTSTKIYFGKYNSLLSANSITKSSIKIDWGTVEIPFFWGGFLDYSPYTQIQLYLPWGVGFVSLDPNEVMPWSPKNSYTQGSFTNGSVQVVTNIELDKGSCVHNVIGNNGRVIGSFGGICGKQIPVVGTNDAARTLALIGAAVSAGTTLGMAATGQPALGKGLAYGKNMSQMNRAEGREMLSDYNSAVSGMLASTRAAAKSPPTYPRAGTFSDATSHLAVQYPYLIISRPSQSMPGQYGRFMGYPSNIFHNHLGEVKGYTEVSSIHLDNIPATSTELDELESILKGGVLL